MEQMIALSKLRHSDSNVRKSGRTEIAQLAGDIEARGLLQNLCVTALKKPRGHYAVFAGGRRLEALQLLAAEGRIDKDMVVSCKVLEGDDATLSEASLAENFQRVNMTPTDECRAFQHFIGEGCDLDAVAKRFGVTRRVVEGRLRLAGLADPVFEALAEGRITLDMAKAYATTADQAKQTRVFEQYGNYSYTTPDQVRRAIAGDALKATDPIAQLVGEDAYVAAGGTIERELFSEKGDRWSDPEIAQGLAAAIMEAEAKRLGEEQGLAWVRPVASAHIYNATDGLYRVNLPKQPMTDAEEARADAIQTRMEEIGDELDSGELDDEAGSALEAEYDKLEDEWNELQRRPTILPDDLKGQIGTFLTLASDGKMVLETTYFSETPIRDPGDDRGGSGSTGATSKAPPPEKIAPGGKPLSARLSDELAMQRRDILAAALLADPALALDYALFAMIDGNRGYERYGTTMKATRPSDPASGTDGEPTQARIAIEQARDALDTTWTEAADVVARFEGFRALDDTGKAAWLALMVAGSIEAKPEYSDTTNPLHARLAAILHIEPAQWWRPTSANFFDRVSKGTLLALLTEIGGEVLAARYAASKKPEVSAACEKLFAGEAITEPAIKDAALAWVPDAMRFDILRAVPVEEDGDDCSNAHEDPEDDPADDCGDDQNDFEVEHPDETLEAAE
ncbi:MAG: chromosome partitioning protein ParB [Sphingomonas sp. SCN 67-18]|nr:ParB/RepB/Spo0J family partition protein [Sphingomonas sp. SCN 67-18]ODU19790.1 MAG: chromosome partitioning protein ParB [Sphingomonas sp. SCN 67-18]